MQLVTGGINDVHLRSIHERGIEFTEEVKAAVAYASGDPQLLRECRDNGTKLTLWCRYDDSLPVTLNILKRFLDTASPNYVCKLVPDIFHAKVIWWVGYGLYVGSANLTDRAWIGNIEAGVFIDQNELISMDLVEEFHSFFEEIDKHSYYLTNEIYRELEDLYRANRDVEDSIKNARQNFNSNRQIPKKNPLNMISKSTAVDNERKRFIKEWNSTLQSLRNIASIVTKKENQPNWVPSGTPPGVQTDQFLHAYYYNKVRSGSNESKKHWLLNAKNKGNPDKALREAVQWWSQLEAPPSHEDEHMKYWYPIHHELLARDRILKLSKDDFRRVVSKVFALWDHAQRISFKSFGFTEKLPHMNQQSRADKFACWLYDQRSISGKTVLEALNYVLWSGSRDDVPKRIFIASHDEQWKIPHLGISSLGEIVGWVFPDDFPPRNGRTSKALTALGYNVKIHTE